MKFRFLGLSLLSAIAAGCPPSCDEGPSLPALSRQCTAPPLTDERGGVVVLRGASLSAESKWASDQLPPYGPDDLERLRDDYGMNAVRLLVFWEAIEPLPGAYDDAYLGALRKWVDDAGALGMHVVVDMHQDVYGRGFGHAGAPYWSCDPKLYATFQPQDPWFLGYLQSEVGACFDRLYAPGPTREAFVAAWARLARALRGADAHVTYDLLNEPFWGSTSAGKFEHEVLTDFYREIIDVVRDVDPTSRFLVEPSPATNVGVPTELASPGRKGVVYGPHFYPAAVELGSGYDGEIDNLRRQVGVLCSDAERLDMPLVVGELGVRRSVPGASDYLHDVYDAFDEARISAFYWSYQRGGADSYGMIDNDGEPAPQGLAVARPYLARTAGKPVQWHWDTDTSTFTAEWIEKGDVEGDTLVKLPRLAFPHGVVVELEPDAGYSIDGSTLHVPAIGTRRHVTIWARPAIAQSEQDAQPNAQP